MWKSFSQGKLSKSKKMKQLKQISCMPTYILLAFLSAFVGFCQVSAGPVIVINYHYLLS